MVKVIGLGEQASFLYDVLRLHIGYSNVYIYPEFFDDLRYLVSRNYRAYIRRLLLYRRFIIIAVWSDYYYHTDILRYVKDNIIFIFPLHSLRELDFLLKIENEFMVYAGFPNRPEFRDYSIRMFYEKVVRELGLPTWLLGLKPKFMMYLDLFDGCDVTPSSCSLMLKNLKNRENIKQYIDFITKLSTKSPLTCKQLLEYIC